MRLPLTDTEHILAQIGIVALMYACVHAWLGANRRALMEPEIEQGEVGDAGISNPACPG